MLFFRSKGDDIEKIFMFHLFFCRGKVMDTKHMKPLFAITRWGDNYRINKLLF